MLTTRRPSWRCSRDRLPEKQSGAHRGVLPEAAKATEDAAFPTPPAARPAHISKRCNVKSIRDMKTCNERQHILR